MSAQPALFDASQAAPPMRRTVAGKRGRGATAVIERVIKSPRKNPTGSFQLRYQFRPLAQYCAPYADGDKAIYEVACNLIWLYFNAVGGLRVARDATVRAWCELLADYTPAEIHAAILAKAKATHTGARDAAEAALKVSMLGQAETFPQRIDHWHICAQQDPEIQRQLRAAGPAGFTTPPAPPRAALRDQLTALCGRRDVAPAPRAADARPGPGADAQEIVIDLAPPPPAEKRRRVFEQHLARAAQNLDQKRREWDALPERRRVTITRTAQAEFIEYLAGVAPGVDFGDVRADPLWLDWCWQAALRLGWLPPP